MANKKQIFSVVTKINKKMYSNSNCETLCKTNTYSSLLGLCRVKLIITERDFIIKDNAAK